MGSALVVEHLGDLRTERREDGRVEQDIESGKDNTADDNADDDFDAGVNVTFARLGGKGGLGGDGDRVYLVTNGIEELFHVVCYLSFLRFDFCLDYIFCTGASSDRVGADSTAADWCCFRALSYSWEISPTRAALDPAVMGWKRSS